jgi:uncharacterized coiled-coil DUF342 family protein
MNSVVLGLLFGGVGAAIAVLSYLSATKANREQAKVQRLGVDAAAYSRAKDIYESALAALRQEVIDMRAETLRVRESNDSLRASNDSLRTEIQHLHEEVSALRARLDINGPRL